MKFRIRNLYCYGNDLRDLGLYVAPYDYDKFCTSKILEFSSEKELREFMKEASTTIKLVGNDAANYFTDVCIIPISIEPFWAIRISYEPID